MSSIHSVWGFLRRHKYLMVIAFFIVMVGFVDEDSFWDRRIRIQEIKALRSEMHSYQDRFERDTKALNDLNSSAEAVERVAREQYLMKRRNEDVYVFMEPAEDTLSEVETEASR